MRMSIKVKVLGTVAGIVALTNLVFAGFGNGYTGSPAPQVLTVPITGGATATIALTNNVEVQSVSVLCNGVNSSMVNFYDCASNAAPWFGTNYTTQQYLSRSSYPTNVVGVFVGYNGYTNYTTNIGVFTFTVTNSPATNMLAPNGTLYAVSGVVSTYPYSMMFGQGVSIYATSNCLVTLYYTKNQ